MIVVIFFMDGPIKSTKVYLGIYKLNPLQPNRQGDVRDSVLTGPVSATS